MVAIDPLWQDRLGRAIEAKHKIMPCSECGGPEVHSLTRAAAKCFRCLRYRETEQVASLPARRRCQRCKQLFRSRMEWLYCEKCREKRRKQGWVIGK